MIYEPRSLFQPFQQWYAFGLQFEKRFLQVVEHLTFIRALLGDPTVDVPLPLRQKTRRIPATVLWSTSRNAGEQVLIFADDVLYVFTCSSYARGKVQAEAVATNLTTAHKETYIRTRHGIYLSRTQALTDLQRQLPQHLMTANRGILVNPDQISDHELIGYGCRRVGLVVAGSNEQPRVREWLVVAESRAPALRRVLGLTRNAGDGGAAPAAARAETGRDDDRDEREETAQTTGITALLEQEA